MNVIENEDRILKKLACKVNVAHISDLRNEQFALKLIRSLLEINANQFDLSEWNDACSFFTREYESHNSSDEARYSLMTYISKERWRLNNISFLHVSQAFR